MSARQCIAVDWVNHAKNERISKTKSNQVGSVRGGEHHSLRPGPSWRRRSSPWRIRRCAKPPIELERDGDGRAVVGRPEAGEVVAGLGGREGEVARVHVLRVVQAVAVGRGDPQRDAVRVRELLRRRRRQGRGPVVGGHDVVLADGHGADLDVVGDAFGVARMQVEAEGAGGERGREDEEEERREGPVVDARGHGGWIVGAPR